MSKLRNRHFFLLDLVLLAAAVYLSFVLRLERFVFNNHLPAYLLLTAAVIVVYPPLFHRMGVCPRCRRYASIDEVALLTGAVTLTLLVASAAAYIISLLLVSPNPITHAIPFVPLLLGLFKGVGLAAGRASTLTSAVPLSVVSRTRRVRSIIPALLPMNVNFFV